MRANTPRLVTAALLVAIAAIALLPLLVGAAPGSRAAPEAAVGGSWSCPDAPALRYKGIIGQSRNTIQAVSGQDTARLVFVGSTTRAFVVWFEVLDGQPGQFREFPWDVPGFEYQGGSSRSLAVVGHAATVHDGRLKIGVTHFRGYFPDIGQDDPARDFYVYDVGCVYRE